MPPKNSLMGTNAQLIAGIMKSERGPKAVGVRKKIYPLRANKKKKGKSLRGVGYSLRLTHNLCILGNPCSLVL